MKLSKIDKKTNKEMTNTEITTTMKTSVEFLDVKDQYFNKDDLICKYKLVNCTTKEGDRVAIFPLGWNYLEDYVVFEWAPQAELGDEVTVKFTNEDLPKNISSNLYQICYINADNELEGASLPFQLMNELNTSPSASSDCSLKQAASMINTKKINRKIRELERERQLQKLKEENSILKECLKSLIEQRKVQSEQKFEDINQLREITEKLYAALKCQQTEMEILKNKLKHHDNYCPNHHQSLSYDLGELKSIPPFPYE